MVVLVSMRKMEANRRNSLKTTGPNDCTIVRFNALKHGLKAKSIILHGEDPELFEEIKRSIYEKYNPENLEESQLADQIIVGMWMQKRMDAATLSILQECENMEREVQWREVCDRDYLKKLAEYRLYSENSVRRGINDLMELQEKRRKIEG